MKVRDVGEVREDEENPNFFKARNAQSDVIRINTLTRTIGVGRTPKRRRRRAMKLFTLHFSTNLQALLNESIKFVEPFFSHTMIYLYPVEVLILIH